MNHKELKVWRCSIALVKMVYTITSEFPRSELFGLVSQLNRAAVSVPTNIAEGAARQSDKEMIQFLYISLGSVAEIETLMIISLELGYVDKNSYQEALQELNEIRPMLLGLIRYLKKVKREE